MGRTRKWGRTALALAAPAALIAQTRTADAQPAARPGAGAGPAMTVAQAVAVAFEHNPDTRTGQAKVQEAESTRAETRGGFGPRLHVDAKAQGWPSPSRLPFRNQNFTAREAVTLTGRVSL